MDTILYNEVSYQLEHLLLEIQSGRLGLPDIQRPFVWKNSKVRDLFDSMLRGYPIGYLLLWESSGNGTSKQIGEDAHSHSSPSHLIIDGQQRLTSLYAVIKGVSVIDKNFKQRRMKIAFHPLERRFEVSTAPIERSPEWISDISDVFKNITRAWGYKNNFIERLEDARVRNGKELSDEERELISSNIQSLLNLKDYKIPALSINASSDEDAVADIFVRVNSGGTNLTETDFILTLLSVVDDSLRNKIEEFCIDAIKPSSSGTSYNQLFAPQPQHIIRIAMAFGFKRARLRYAYMLLRGKDFETEEFSEDLQKDNFRILSTVLDKVLNLNNWHEFINCVLSAGYISNELILAENNLVYTYMMFLIGKYYYGITNKHVLRKCISRWYYMVAVSAYYSTSTETKVQADLNDLKAIEGEEGFQKFIDDRIESVFTNDYFSITLPNHMETSSPNSPAWKAYCAAHVLLDVKALFSNVLVKNLFGPGSSGSRSAVEKHHLFPKAYLSKIGFNTDRERNQIANFEYIEWSDNMEISDDAPSVYWPQMVSGLSEDDLGQIEQYHAIPRGWENMEYLEFLDKRRKLMAEIIRKGFDRLK